MAYNRKYKRRKRYTIDRFRFVRFIVILLIVVAAVVFGCVKLFGGDKAGETNPAPSVSPAADAAITSPDPEASAQPSANPSSTVDPSASPAASASPEPSAAPVASPEPIAADSGDLLKKIKVNDGIKTAYLTFDDGPTKSVTPMVLDVLRRYNVKATFFQLGKLIESNPDMAYRVYEEGHLLANHSYGHEYSDLYASEESFMNEINKTQDLIKGIAGVDTMKLVRFPGGSHNAGSYGERKQQYKKALETNGYVHCDWNALSKDSEGAKKNAQELLECVKETVGEQEDVVILMHDANGKQTTAESLADVIEYLMAQGYELRRLDNK